MRTITGRPAIYMAAVWQFIGAALCVPRVIAQDGVDFSINSLVFPVALACDLLLAVGTIFAMFFHWTRASSIAIITFGSLGIVATFFFGSYELVAAVHTACCCGSSACFLSDSNQEALAANSEFCGTASGQACIANNASMWLFWAGLCVSQVAIVLLTAAAALHARVVAIERERYNEFAKAEDTGPPDGSRGHFRASWSGAEAAESEEGTQAATANSGTGSISAPVHGGSGASLELEDSADSAVEVEAGLAAAPAAVYLARAQMSPPLRNPSPSAPYGGVAVAGLANGTVSSPRYPKTTSNYAYMSGYESAGSYRSHRSSSKPTVATATAAAAQYNSGYESSTSHRSRNWADIQ